MNGDGLGPDAMRIARPVRDISVSLSYYVDTLGLAFLGQFAGHDGYDGAFVGSAGSDWRIELTTHESGFPAPTPTTEDLLVFYLSPDSFAAASTRLKGAGVDFLQHENPYWSRRGAVVCRDPDGYLVVLCPSATATS